MLKESFVFSYLYSDRKIRGFIVWHKVTYIDWVVRDSNLTGKSKEQQWRNCEKKFILTSVELSSLRRAVLFTFISPTKDATHARPIVGLLRTQRIIMTAATPWFFLLVPTNSLCNIILYLFSGFGSYLAQINIKYWLHNRCDSETAAMQVSQALQTNLRMIINVPFLKPWSLKALRTFNSLHQPIAV